MSFLVLTNLSTDDKPRVANANRATASTRYCAGAISVVEKLLWYIVIHSVSEHTIPTNLFEDGVPVSSLNRPANQVVDPLVISLMIEKNFFMFCVIYFIYPFLVFEFGLVENNLIDGVLEKPMFDIGKLANKLILFYIAFILFTVGF